MARTLPPCNHCGAIPQIEAVGPEGEHRQHFVICRGSEESRKNGTSPCAGPDNTGLRPLTNGFDAPAKAERAWIEDCDRRKELGI